MGNQKQVILPVVLKGSNYLLWSRTTKTALRSRGLWEHCLNDPKETNEENDGGELESQASFPEGEEEGDSKWIQEDQLVLAVLQSSLEQSILASYSYVETAKELWETLAGVYGNISNLSRTFEVKKALNDLQQEEKAFKDLFGDFRGLWAELEMLRPPTLDAREMNERREQDQVFGLLLTLNKSYQGLIYHILRFDKLPTLNQVCMMVQKEEGSRGLFKGTSDIAYMSKGKESVETANISKGKEEVVSANISRGDYQSEKWNIRCEHCQKKGHTKEKCWTLHPHMMPKNLKERGQTSRGNTGGTPNPSNDVVRRSDLEALIRSIAKLSESGKSSLASMTLKPVIIDSGASHHMFSNRELLSNVKPHNGKVKIANGQDIKIRGIGDLEVFSKTTKALFLPEFESNLLSVGKVTKDLDCLAVFAPHDVWFQDIKSGKTIGEGCSKDGLYVLDFLDNKQPVVEANSASSSLRTSSVWHARLGHPNSKVLKLVMPSLTQDNQGCEACILGKQCRTVYQDSSTVYNECFDLVHSDVWTAPCISKDQYKYFVSFIDEKSKHTWVTLLPSKSNVLEAFINFYKYVETQYKTKIKVLRSDNGGEYMSNQFREFVSSHGIVHQTSCAYTPQQNGVAERKNRHLMEVSRTMMFDKGVPKSFWADAVMTSCYLINRLPTKQLSDLSPYEVLNKTKPVIDHLKVFGCVCFVFVPDGLRNKLEKKSTRCMFIGYSTTQKGYKCYDPEAKRMYVSREVIFDEEKGFFEKKNWNSLKDLTSSVDRASVLQALMDGLIILANKKDPSISIRVSDHSSPPDDGNEHENLNEDHTDRSDTNEKEVSRESGEESEEEEATLDESEEAKTDIEESNLAPPLRRSERVRYGPENWKNTRVYYNNKAIAHPIQDVYSTTSLPSKHQVFLSKIDKHRVPTSYDEACLSEVWVKAMLEEMESMRRNETWDLVEKPSKKKVIGCRWVYTIKYTSSGEIERYKARLVAKGYTQKYGEDYTETFAPVAKLHSVRVLLSIATNLSWDLWQMDVKNAFLQGTLEEEVYMVPPEGFDQNHRVCKLKKAIYGLKQSPRAWYQKLSTCLLNDGFKRSEADHTLFTTKGEKGMTVVLIYVDDIIITGDDCDGIRQTKDLLKKSFDIKDLGELKYFLGIEICKLDDGLFLSQRKYALDLLEETGKLGSKPAVTPIEESYKDESEGEVAADVKQYQRMVGKLIYLTITRPDICFAVNQISQHMQAPTIHHWKMAERILKYIKGAPGKGVWMRHNASTEIVGYCDADWAGDKCDRKSTTGYCTFVGGNLVTWKSKKQKVVSRSSAEAEYRAMANITGELMWLKSFLKDLGVEQIEPMRLHCDNQAAMHIATNSVFHERTKHIEVDCHYIREKVQAGVILLSYVKSSDQVADIFTKATTSRVCNELQSKMGLMDLHKPAILRGSVELKPLDKDKIETKLDGLTRGDKPSLPSRVQVEPVQGKGKDVECNTSIWEMGECSSSSSSTNSSYQPELKQTRGQSSRSNSSTCPSYQPELKQTRGQSSRSKSSTCPSYQPELKHSRSELEEQLEHLPELATRAKADSRRHAESSKPSAALTSSSTCWHDGNVKSKILRCIDCSDKHKCGK